MFVVAGQVVLTAGTVLTSLAVLLALTALPVAPGLGALPAQMAPLAAAECYALNPVAQLLVEFATSLLELLALYQKLSDAVLLEVVELATGFLKSQGHFQHALRGPLHHHYRFVLSGIFAERQMPRVMAGIVTSSLRLAKLVLGEGWSCGQLILTSAVGLHRYCLSELQALALKAP